MIDTPLFSIFRAISAEIDRIVTPYGGIFEDFTFQSPSPSDTALRRVGIANPSTFRAIFGDSAPVVARLWSQYADGCYNLQRTVDFLMILSKIVEKPIEIHHINHEITIICDSRPPEYQWACEMLRLAIPGNCRIHITPAATTWDDLSAAAWEDIIWP